MLTRRQVAAALALPGFLATGAGAQPVVIDTAKIVIGFPPGGTMDALARRVGEKLRGRYAGTAVVDNRPGAGGQIAAAIFKDMPADGTALLLQPSSVVTIYPFTYPKLQYGAGSFTAVSTGAYTDHGIAVGPAVPAIVRTFAEFAAWLNANPGRGSFGNPGAGSMSHMVAALAAKYLGIADAQHPSYRGTTPGVQDLLGGQIAAFCGPIGDYLQHPGRLRILAIAGQVRSPFLPDTPTLTELGHPLVAREWYGFFLPARAPADLVERVGRVLAQALAERDVADAMAKVGMEVQSSTPAQFTRQVRQESAQWERLTKSLGFTVSS
ncbi:tripartite tricarboxylate transporter substrate-binding protein [Variovorax sp. LT1R16]|uniref:tripartite tricarboxylate transporter substrate-binding protein n=1 Tax=Variovorax sp. LT1R16 TaxID=3443728 RepID=UPI003F4494A3